MKRLILFCVLFSILMISACSPFTLSASTPTPSPRPTFTLTVTSTPTRIMTPTPLLYRRLENGTYIKGENGSCSGGCNSLTVVNGDSDTVVLLQTSINPLPAMTTAQVPTEISPVAATIVAMQVNTLSSFPASHVVYLRANQRFTFIAMLGVYRICFTQGEDWDSSLNRFTRKATYACLKDYYYYTISYPKYRKDTIILNPAKGGNVVLIPQTQASFPRINK